MTWIVYQLFTCTLARKVVKYLSYPILPKVKTRGNAKDPDMKERNVKRKLVALPRGCG